MDRRFRTWLVPLFCLLPAYQGNARAQETPPSAPVPTLRWSWAEADHPSGIYYAKSDAKLTLLADNLSTDSLPIEGQILFGQVDRDSNEFKIISVTPLTTADLAPGQRAKIPLSLTFAAAGDYELRWAAPSAARPQPATLPAEAGGQPINNAAGVSLQCIFAPRSVANAAAAEDTPWITPLPHAAPTTPGLLTDLAHQTTIHRFLIDERFAFDPTANIGLAFGAPLGSAKEVDALLAEAAHARASFSLRIALPENAPAADQPRLLAAFKQYLTDALRRATIAGRCTIRAIAIVPDPHTDAAAFKTYYLAAYEIAKHADKSIAMLGAGTAQATLTLVINQDLTAYLDAAAVTDTARQPALLAASAPFKALKPPRPLWVLPPQINAPWAIVPPAAALAQGALVVAVPPPSVDRGVTEHLLGGAAFFQRVHLALPMAAATAPDGPQDVRPAESDLPYIAVFQGDGYSVAAVAGLAAGTPLDARYPDLARSRTAVQAADDAADAGLPVLEVGDDTHTMRVVDAQGTAVDCRRGDSLLVPAGNEVLYLLQGSTAEELAGSLRPSTGHRFPLFEISAAKKDGLTLTLRNISPVEMGGHVRVFQMAADGGADAGTLKPQLIGERDVAPVAAGKKVEISVETAGAQMTGAIVVEMTLANGKILQRTGIGVVAD